ncbi:MAG: methylated-DNA--[protein]-cysteine S-methyltransferase [Candidatus Rokubacteria bacterium]|nr:methylated-DNA--[protein]-cysteine S-methyltransferase [Candidatus Rokubacteria bacterium]
MTPDPILTIPCNELDPALAAVATGEADEPAKRRVDAHVAACAPCRMRLEGYRAIDVVVAGWRDGRREAAPIARARAELDAQLADLRSRLVTYRIYPSPLGHLLIAKSERGVALVEYLKSPTFAASRLARRTDYEAVPGGADIDALYGELLDYLDGRRTRLEWTLDMRFARGDFDRQVLGATERIPYGAVMSYAGVAAAIGRPRAARAVAQALRWNPVPIAVPCHRVIGTSGCLTGYAGDKVALKERLLSVEGVQMRRLERHLRVARHAMYVVDPEAHCYCLPSCYSNDRHQISRLPVIASIERAIDAGLTPCENCRPDLHPLTA